MRRVVSLIWGIAALGLLGPGLSETSAQTTLSTTQVATGLSSPLYVTSPPGDFSRLFIVEQPGRIKILTGGSVLPTPFLDISGMVASGGERGLLGLAFDPDYFSNGFFYVDYTASSSPLGHTVIARFSVQGDPNTSNVANAASQIIMKTITQPEANHNGGCVQFGPDGMLYVAMGDGGGANDMHGTDGNGQNTSVLLGKLLRLDVDDPPNYIPSDNPFVGQSGLDEIWAYGLRNPWRFSFDRATGDLYIGDVGQGAREEVDFQSSSSSGGENYGWRCMEGFACTGSSGCTCNAPSLVLPIHDYTHGGSPFRCSITGGFVYRGTAIPGLQGTYFFADWCSAQVWSFRYDGSMMTDFMERTDDLVPDFGDVDNIASFGEDAAGELYICDLTDGDVFKIVADLIDCNGNGVEDSEDIAQGTSEDCNNNGIPDECDLELSSNDCNGNSKPDECDLSAGTSPDCNNNNVPDECEADCNDNGVPDDCDAGTTSPDCNNNDIPDECELGTDCNANGFPDDCDIAGGTSMDCQPNGTPDECEGPDCNGNDVPDDCDLANGTSGDCNSNSIPDECDPDCDGDGIPNSCDGQLTLFEDDFETDKGWTVENVMLTDGAWERADPGQTLLSGNVVQPEDDHSDPGTLCYVTDKTGLITNQSDVDGGPTRLLSPVLDLSGGSITLRYYYWFQSINGVTDALSLDVSVDGGTNWTNITTQTVPASSWRLGEVVVDNFVVPTSTTRFRFSTSDPGADSYTEALIDDVLITGPDCPPDSEGPSIVSAVSRKTHGAAGDFDVPVGAAMSESRAGGISKLVVTFDENIQALDGMLTTDDVAVSPGMVTGVSIMGSSLTLDLSGTGDKSCMQVSFSGISDSGGNPVTDVLEALIVYADTDNDALSNGSDVTSIKAASSPNLVTNAGQARGDLNLDGRRGVADVTSAKASSSPDSTSCD